MRPLDFLTRHFLPRPWFAMLVGMKLLLMSALLLSLHASAIREVREVGLPAAVTLPALEKRIAVLSEQVEVSELQQAMAQGSEQEMIKTFILPSEPELDRVLSLLDVLRNHLQKTGVLKGMSAIKAGDAVVSETDGVRAYPLKFEVDVTEEGLKQLLSVLHLSGFLTIGDALQTDEIHRLLTLTEEEDPSSVSVVESFLSTPLIRYAREPKPYEAQMQRSFASPAFAAAFSDLVQHSLLQDAREILGGDIGRVLTEQRLWPTRFLTVEQVSIQTKEKGSIHMMLEIRAYAG